MSVVSDSQNSDFFMKRSQDEDTLGRTLFYCPTRASCHGVNNRERPPQVSKTRNCCFSVSCFCFGHRQINLNPSRLHMHSKDLSPNQLVSFIWMGLCSSHLLPHRLISSPGVSSWWIECNERGVSCSGLNVMSEEWVAACPWGYQPAWLDWHEAGMGGFNIRQRQTGESA